MFCVMFSQHQSTGLRRMLIIPQRCEESIIFLIFQKPFIFDRDKNSTGDYQFSISNIANRQ